MNVTFSFTCKFQMTMKTIKKIKEQVDDGGVKDEMTSVARSASEMRISKVDLNRNTSLPFAKF